jgi:ubiquinone biosynthesis accessory factor UbiJ
MEPVYQGLSTVITTFLAHDPDMGARLARFSGKTLAVELQPPTMTFYIALDADGVRISATTTQSPSAVIKGSLQALMALAWQPASASRSLFGHGVELSGDLEFAQAVKQAFDDLDIDFQEWLASWIGDVASYQLSSGLQGIAKKGKQLTAALQADFSEFITDEVHLSPRQSELADHYLAVETLRDDVERLGQRVHRLVNGE